MNYIYYIGADPLPEVSIDIASLEVRNFIDLKPGALQEKLGSGGSLRNFELNVFWIFEIPTQVWQNWAVFSRTDRSCLFYSCLFLSFVGFGHRIVIVLPIWTSTLFPAALVPPAPLGALFYCLKIWWPPMESWELGEVCRFRIFEFSGFPEFQLEWARMARYFLGRACLV